MLTIYKASAGSGKTFTLAYRYIKLLLGVKAEDGDRYMLNTRKYLGGRPVERRPHSHILAITFTNKATAEMKSRIIAELDALGRVPGADGKDTPYAAMLTAEYGCSREDLAEMASRSLADLLHDYGAFNVSTIDSFFQTILRTFAREVERQGDFRLELDNSYVIGAAMSMLFDDLNDGAATAGRAVSRWLESMSTVRVMDGDDYNPFNRGGGMYRSILSGLRKTFNEDFEARAAEMHEYMADPSRLERFGEAIDKAVKDIVGQEKALSQQAVNALSGVGIDIDRVKGAGPMISSSATDGLQEKYAKILLSPAPLQKYMQSIRARDYQTDVLFKKAGRGQAEPSTTACDIIYDWVDGICRLYVRRDVLGRMAAARDTLWALSYIDDYINRFRQENNLVLLSDTNSLLRAIISEEETPFIYERVGLELRHFLIDEFQDTSRMQWDNLKPLVANSLASLHDNLIIGDVKQSIYRWRGGDPTLLGSRVAEQDFAGLNEVRGEQPGENTNYRSAHDIVRFNNTLFACIAATRGIDGYGGVTQALPANTAGLTAHIDIADLTDENLENSIDSYLTAAQIESMTADGIEPTAANVALERCAAAIIDQHSRGYRWGDIVILCRRNRPDATSVVEYLMRRYPEIKIMSDEALLVRNSASVKLIVSMLEIIDRAWSGDEAVETATAEAAADELVKHRPRRDCAIMIDRFEYFAAHGSTVEQALSMALDPTVAIVETDETSGSLNDDLQILRELAPANLVALVEAIIERKLTPAQRTADLAYIAAFVDLVIDFCNNYNPSLHSFIEYWTSHRDTATIGSGASQDAVTVMTVHKAKGLEWPCVHIPLMNWDLVSQPKSQWFSLDEVDEVSAEDRPPLIYLRAAGTFALDGSPLAAQTERQIKSETEDNLNVAYVAFTRAVRELHVSMLGKPAAGSMRTAISETVASPSPLHGDLYIDLKAHTDSRGNLSIGHPTKSGPHKEPAATLPGPEYAVAFTKLNSRLTRLEDMTTSDPSALDPDIGDMPDPEITDRGDTEKLREAARNGMNMHAILSRMTVAADLDRAIGAETANLREGDAEFYRDTLGRAFAEGGEPVARWFSPDAVRVLTEQPIYLPDRNESFRPDRIVWNADGTIDIVDYKFTSEELDTHRSQVAGYARLLVSMGYRDVRAYLWYPAQLRTVCVVG
ncbi:MAG: UvrD-helicase domain-containing protein [Bacteroidales bacterium]|nr:UvrD-helicase domain-containing protein [Bacteroidales bacterium]